LICRKELQFYFSRGRNNTIGNYVENKEEEDTSKGHRHQIEK